MPVLYTPELLRLATVLADHPLDPARIQRATARSRICGGVLELDLTTDAEARIVAVGMQAQACAVGQAAAALFAQGATGADAVMIRETSQAMTRWLEVEGALPDWPGIAALGPARDHPGRHGAIMLPWIAALDALSIADAPV